MNKDFDSYINQFKSRLQHLFHEQENIDDLSIERGLPEALWTTIRESNLLSVVIPESFGGRGGRVDECLRVLSVASYESLSLSLVFGINMGLFLEPLAKYGNPEVQQVIFNKFLYEKAMGGLMITEPDFGSDALSMRTSFEEEKGTYHIKGQKHWQGLTGMADFWIVAARQKMGPGKLSRDVSFFITENALRKQKIQVEQYFNNLGLYMIPYGLNKIDVSVPENHRLQPHTTGIKMMLDILHRSRMQFPGMGMGFIQRMLDEALHHCTHRKVAGKMLVELDSVQYQLSRIQSSYTLCSGMCAKASSISGIEHDASEQGLEANSMKALVTDLMQEAAQICLQLAGASGYKLEHIAGRGIVDSRAFQIFEGSNEMLYTQIADTIVKQMKKRKEKNLYASLSRSDYCNLITKRFKQHLNFEPPTDMVQRQLINLGKVIARLICLQNVFNMVEKGYRTDLYDNCMKHIEMDVKKLMSNLSVFNNAKPIMEYTEQSDWKDFI